jgi:hypothetical protein
MECDITIELRFKTTTEGGRKNSIIGGVYSCPMLIDGEAFECRLYFENKTIQLGESYVVNVKFMNPDIVLPKLAIGKRVALWEGKIVGDGNVIKIL